VAVNRVGTTTSDASGAKSTVISGLAPDVPDHRSSGFRAAIRHITLPSGARILEVGGLSGDHTTIHLLDVFDNPIDIVEIDEERASNLQSKYDNDPTTKDRIRLYNSDAMDFTSIHTYDLLIIDMPTGSIDFGYEEILPNISRYLSVGGTAIVYTIYDHAAAYDVDDPPGNGDQPKAFMLSFFGAPTLTVERVDERLRPTGFAAIGLVDRWMLKGHRKGHGWVCLEKLPLPAA
jgi:predicted O-methyltransferase YrrM